MKNRVRKIIDILMTILFIIMMGYHITGNKLHEIFGIITFGLFITHNILNIQWYKTIFKGKYNFRRLFQLVVNIALFIAMLLSMISGMMISANIFAFLNIPTTMFGRKLHMVATSWTFILMAIHVGMHLNILLSKVNKKMKDSIFEYIYYLILVILMIYGGYTLISGGIWKDMFLVSEFKFFDYNQNPLVFYFNYFSVLCFVALSIYFLFKIKNKQQIKLGKLKK